MDRVELLHGGQRVGLAGADQRALGDRGLADPAADRRGDAGVAEGDVGGVEGGPCGADIGFGLLLRGDGVFQVLLADGVDLGQLGDALCAQPRCVGRGFGAGKLGAGAVGLGAVAGVIDLVQGLAGTDQAAFGEQALGNDATHLWAHFGDQEGVGAAGQLAGEADLAGLQGGHGDLAGTALRALLFTAAACGKGQGDRERQRGETVREWGHGGDSRQAERNGPTCHRRTGTPDNDTSAEQGGAIPRRGHACGYARPSPGISGR